MDIIKHQSGRFQIETVELNWEYICDFRNNNSENTTGIGWATLANDLNLPSETLKTLVPRVAQMLDESPPKALTPLDVYAKESEWYMSVIKNLTFAYKSDAYKYIINLLRKTGYPALQYSNTLANYLRQSKLHLELNIDPERGMRVELDEMEVDEVICPQKYNLELGQEIVVLESDDIWDTSVSGIVIGEYDRYYVVKTDNYTTTLHKY